MKKIMGTILIFVCVIVAGILFIRIKNQETDVTKTKTKVGFILNGKVDDHSWGESHYNGMEKSASELNLEVIYKENVPDDESCVEAIEELIDSGCKIIICNVPKSILRSISFTLREWKNSQICLPILVESTRCVT